MPRRVCECCGELFQVEPLDLHEKELSEGLYCSVSCVQNMILSFPVGNYPKPKAQRTEYYFEPAKGVQRSRYAFRSEFEVLVAQWFTVMGEPFQYEPYMFTLDSDFGEAHYTVDFYMRHRNLFFEAKGKWTIGNMSKIRRLREEHPGIKLLVIPWRMRDEIEKEVLKSGRKRGL